MRTSTWEGRALRIAVLFAGVAWSCCCVAADSTTILDEFLAVARELRDGDYQLADIHLRKVERTLARPGLSLVEQLDARLSLSHQKMIRGEAEAAATQIEVILRLMQRAIDSGAAWEAQRNFVYKGRGIAYMHLAEQVRCGVERGPENCTVAPAWSRPEHHALYYGKALDSFLTYLEHYPQDISHAGSPTSARTRSAAIPSPSRRLCGSPCSPRADSRPCPASPTWRRCLGSTPTIKPAVSWWKTSTATACSTS